MGSTCKICLFTYRRNNTLTRALQSLLNQTHTNWICELHNDDPSDRFPEELSRKTNDKRIRIVNHKTNLGSNASFNLLYENTDADYVSMLEDDNWWEPQFLETLIRFMDANPKVDVCWANMKKWRETDSGWEDTGEYIWPLSQEQTFFHWPVKKQLFGAVHSNGAMLVRARLCPNLKLPADTPFLVTESLRERLFPFPIVLHHDHLANFAITKETARKKKDGAALIHAAILFATFIKYDQHKTVKVEDLWRSYKNQKVRHTNMFIWAALLFPEIRYILKYASVSTYLFFAGYYLRNPREFISAYKNRHAFQYTRELIDKNTKARFEESHHA